MFIFKVSFKTLKILGLAIILITGTFFTQRIVSVVSSAPEPIERIDTSDKLMALTINVDWGEEYLPGILDALDRYQAKVTFFVTGRWASKNPELLREMAKRGHEIQNHGYSHPHPDQISVQANEQEILKTEQVISGILGQKTNLYAPPYGERGTNGLKAASDLGYRTVLWTLDTVDWRADSTPQIITNRIVNPSVRYGIRPVKEGAIVLMHPKENTLEALPTMLGQLQQEGFRFATLNELITLESDGNTTS